MKFVQLGLMHLYESLDPQAQFALSSNMSLVMEITRAIARSYCPRDMSVRLAEKSSNDANRKQNERRPSSIGESLLYLCSSDK